MLKDIIYRRSRVDTSTTTNLLPFGFFGKYVPMSLDVDDSFNIKGCVPTDGDFLPRRCFYLDDINCYLLFDVANTHMAMLYLIDAETHTTLTSYTYMLDTCPNYKLYDELVDMTVHHEAMDDTIRVTFLITNSELRSASLVSFNLTYQKLGEPHNETKAGPVFQLNLGDVAFFADIVPAGKEDEIALGYSMTTARQQSGGHSWEYPEFTPSDIIPMLKTQFHVGKFNNKYCNLTIDEKGRFVVLIASRIKCWMGPLLSFPIDSQYIVILDSRGMNQQFALIGPQFDTMSFDESTTHQPYKYSITSWDGRYLLCLEDRKSRFLNPRRVFVDPATDVPGDSYIYSGAAWGGGEVADRYYPARAAGVSFTNSSTVTRVGYPTEWENTSYVEPIHREAIWTVMDICDLFQEIEPPESEPEPPYSADILFLVDDSESMTPAMTQVKNNIANMFSTLVNLGVSDLRIGVASYMSNLLQLRDPNNKLLPVWTTTQSGANAMAAQLSINASGVSSIYGSGAHPYSAICNGLSTYTFRNIKAKFVVLVTDVVSSEGDPQTEADASLALQSKGVIPYVVGTTQNLYSSMIVSAGGAFMMMNGSWGALLASDLAMLVASKAGVSEEPEDWYTKVAKAWKPTVFYNFMPEFDLMANSLVTIFHDSLTFVANGTVIRMKLNYLTVFDDFPNLGGKPQDSFYLPGLVPGSASKAKFVIRNESYTGTMNNLTLNLLNKPDDVDVVVKHWPNELAPRATAMIEIDATYTPSEGSGQVVKHLDAQYEVSYWMRHDLACSHVNSGDAGSLMSITPELYFVEHPQNGLTVGYAKQINFNPLYTLSFVTKTETEEEDLVDQPGWNDKIYILTPTIMKSNVYASVDPTSISHISGYSTTENGCCWLKSRGPVRWITTRDYECKVNVKTWYLVNQSSTNTYVAHVDLDSESMPNMAGTGLIVVDYPEGNIIPPGASVPVEFKWQPIFNPDGEQMTKELTKHKVMGSQDGTITSVIDTEPGWFNQVLFKMAVASNYNNTQFTHIYVENIKGDGRDIPVKPNQALHKLDIKDLKSIGAIYDTKSFMDVDTDIVPTGFQFVQPAGIWGGVRDDPSINDVMLPLGMRPSDAFDYVEWLSTGGGLPSLPHYVDHKFQANPDYLYHADDGYPYQLAPFNKEYAKPYVGTYFLGDVTIKSQTVAKSSYTSLDKYDEDTSPLIPCDASGAELAGWLLNDIWPVSGDWGSSLDILATEDDYIFKRTVYVKNRHSTDAFNVTLLYASNVVNGVSIQGISFPGGTGVVNPGAVIQLEVSFRLHYTYQEAKYVNMVRDYLYIPRFDY